MLIIKNLCSNFSEESWLYLAFNVNQFVLSVEILTSCVTRKIASHQTITLSISYCTATDKSAPISVLPSCPPYLPSSFFFSSFLYLAVLCFPSLCAMDRPGLRITHPPNSLLIWFYQSSALHLVSLIFLSMMVPSIKHIWESFPFKQWLLFP